MSVEFAFAVIGGVGAAAIATTAILAYRGHIFARPSKHQTTVSQSASPTVEAQSDIESSGKIVTPVTPVQSVEPIQSDQRTQISCETTPAGIVSMSTQEEAPEAPAPFPGEQNNFSPTALPTDVTAVPEAAPQVDNVSPVIVIATPKRPRRQRAPRKTQTASSEGIPRRRRKQAIMPAIQASTDASPMNAAPITTVSAEQDPSVTTSTTASDPQTPNQ